MINHRHVLATLRSRLLGVDGVDPDAIQWENQTYEPPTGETEYIRETYMPADESQVSNGETHAVGLVQYDIVVPVGSGTEGIDDLAYRLTKAFRPSQSITGATTVIITKAQRLKSSRASLGRYTVPIQVFWRAHAPFDD